MQRNLQNNTIIKLIKTNKMADISKCNDIHCPSKDKCYRYTVPSGLWQSYTNFERESDADNCNYFWNNKDEKNDDTIATDQQDS